MIAVTHMQPITKTGRCSRIRFTYTVTQIDMETTLYRVKENSSNTHKP